MVRTVLLEKIKFTIATAGVIACALGALYGCGGPSRNGAPIGGLIGRYMDEQAGDLEKIEGAAARRVGDGIKITWDSAILFDFDSAMLSTASHGLLREMADVLSRYPDTDIVIAGHTDSAGSEEHNRKLSERRALAVGMYLVDLGVAPSRLRTEGHGALRPAAAEDTEEGRRRNRRVEIDIRANEELKARAEAEQDE